MSHEGKLYFYQVKVVKGGVLLLVILHAIIGVLIEQQLDPVTVVWLVVLRLTKCLLYTKNRRNVDSE